jgi:hypothetical protein
LAVEVLAEMIVVDLDLLFGLEVALLKPKIPVDFLHLPLGRAFPGQAGLRLGWQGQNEAEQDGRERDKTHTILLSGPSSSYGDGRSFLQ